MMILNIFEAISFILLAGLMGIVCGLFSYFLDYCFWPGSIFKNYLPWLAMLVLQSRKPKEYQTILSLRSVGNGWQDVATSAASDMFWYKILGGCPVCFNIWTALISWTVICFVSFLPWYYGVVYVMVSSWLIRKLVKAEY